MTAAYTQDVTTLSDQELEALSAEMQEAYERPGYDGDSEWTDDEAETRYHEMQRELRRRHPRPPHRFDGVLNYYIAEGMKAIAHSIEFTRSMAESDADFARGDKWKVGDTIQIRKPVRFGQTFAPFSDLPTSVKILL